MTRGWAAEDSTLSTIKELNEQKKPIKHFYRN
jgi:hypothetical protein